ncbi:MULTISPECIES: site-specific integrase [Vagococcus]|uniref:site-specific integrase n=1 Tax=Vagococcus TaxID=2737 RepID=UPI000EEF5147|nr:MULTISPECIES: site-specific integrase [Vagococcus]MDT2807554.1 tyrosine-type recombinase/integrase [Vagococcus lutrae]HCT96369.1 site-specific integrase [Vagococcus sp.]
MQKEKEDMFFYEYFDEWTTLYKVGAVREVTLSKYRMTGRHLKRLAPKLKLKQLTRPLYQELLNNFAIDHEKQTTTDFHFQLKGAILDAVEEGLLSNNPTRKVVIKGKLASYKKIKYLSQFDLKKLLEVLELGSTVNEDWLFLLMAKTGIRFSEALALTPADFDFVTQQVNIQKTWAYKDRQGGFQPTKNKASQRRVSLDWKTNMQMAQLTQALSTGDLIFVKKKIYNSTLNHRLKRHCVRAGIPIISMHGLRHTHASLLLYEGVSIASVARRLGHADMTTTQKTYLHIIQELENQDTDKIMRCLATL